jgi:hypothetical protein
MMKIKYLIFILIFTCLFYSSCSNNDNIDVEVTVTRCFVVLDKDTNNPIDGVRVFLDGELVCGYLGCGRRELGFEVTAANGNVCFTISQTQMEELTSISCSKEEYKYFSIENPPSNLKVIYLEKS